VYKVCIMRIHKLSQSRRRHCRSCHELFTPNSRTKGKQKYCSKTECQSKRQRVNEKDWRERNPDCLAYQQEQSRKWHKDRPEYSRQRRANDPELLERNRDQTSERMQKLRGEQLMLQQFCFGNIESIEKSGII